MSRRSAVIVRIDLPARLERLRLRHDPLATRGVPAHVTLLVPFLPPTDLTPAVRRTLAAIAGSISPFHVRFARVARFPEAVWLAPEPAAPFRDLSARLEAAFPDHPPYAGQHEEVVPHLTIGLGSGPELDRLERHATDFDPFEASVRTIEVIAEGGNDRWRRRWRIPLGGLRR